MSLQNVRNLWGVRSAELAFTAPQTRTSIIAPLTGVIVLHNIMLSCDGITDITLEAYDGASTYTKKGPKLYIPGRGVGIFGDMWLSLPANTGLVVTATGTAAVELYIEYHLQN